MCDMMLLRAKDMRLDVRKADVQRVAQKHAKRAAPRDADALEAALKRTTGGTTIGRAPPTLVTLVGWRKGRFG